MLSAWVVPCTAGSALAFHKLIKGARMGVLATAPMSLSMLLGWELFRVAARHGHPAAGDTTSLAQELVDARCPCDLGRDTGGRVAQADGK